MPCARIRCHKPSDGRGPTPFLETDLASAAEFPPLQSLQSLREIHKPRLLLPAANKTPTASAKISVANRQLNRTRL